MRTTQSPLPLISSIMNHSTYHNQKPSPTKSHKHTTKRLTEDQVRLLESYFDSSKKLEPERKHQLSCQLGIPPRQIAICSNWRPRCSRQNTSKKKSNICEQSSIRCGDDVGSSSKSLEDDTEAFCGFGKQVLDAAEMYTAARMMGMDILHFSG
ncbi:unnamed protein product [Lactuca saligna]|uniref:Homeobox-leucine zipper protein n=1 Tax=Lactuca saligna TaxID=75948 RepID=A0AA36E8T9_LACSI|nr:unnamed protein product [Lactuca saligna]